MYKITNRNLCKDNENYLNRQGKRRLAKYEEVEFDLKKDLKKLFDCFYKAIEMYNENYAKVPPHKRIRNYSAVSFNQCLVSSAFDSFSKSCYFGKYKRFFLSIEGYTIQFKKLNGKGFPMNIKTGNVNDIANQLSLDLFGDSQSYNPILFFGYKTDRLGNFVSPQIVYIDEGVIQFVITEENVRNLVFHNLDVNSEDQNNDVKIKEIKGLKQAN